MSIDAVLFDLDGTLIDSLADIAAALNHALDAHGLPVHSDAAFRELIGGGVVDLIARATGQPGARSEVLAAFEARYDANLVVSSAPYPGVVELLAALGARGLPLGVVSNKPHRWTERVVAEIFPDRFAAVIGQSAARPAKPAPDMALAAAAQLGAAPRRCLYVGDTEVDVATARAAGMIAVGVSWGFRPHELGGCAHIVAHPLDLLDLCNSSRWTGNDGTLTEE